MARRWQVVKVELLSGRGQFFEHPAGRVLICPPNTSFESLGLAIDLAFARWDLSHLRVFGLSNGTEVVDASMAGDLLATPFGPIPRVVLLSQRVKAHIGVGDCFTYTFDLGDDWLHRCTVLGLADPEEELGGVPTVPESVWGWGAIPDQYGRRWDDDDGTDDRRPEPIGWDELSPPRDPAPALAADRLADVTSVPEFIAVVTGTDPTELLQECASKVQELHREASPSERQALQPYLASVMHRLGFRGREGDESASQELLRLLRDQSAD